MTKHFMPLFYLPRTALPAALADPAVDPHTDDFQSSPV